MHQVAIIKPDVQNCLNMKKKVKGVNMNAVRTGVFPKVDRDDHDPEVGEVARDGPEVGEVVRDDPGVGEVVRDDPEIGVGVRNDPEVEVGVFIVEVGRRGVHGHDVSLMYFSFFALSTLL